jgi:hypothetical protein
LAERRRSGYLDRLLDVGARPRSAAARPPRQIAWGPPAVIAPEADGSAVQAARTEPTARRTVRPASSRRPLHPETEPAAPLAGQPVRRARAAGSQPAARAQHRAPPEPAPASSPAAPRPAEPPRTMPGPPAPATSRPPPLPLVPRPQAPEDRAQPLAAPVPPVLERLEANSLRLPARPGPGSARPPAAPAATRAARPAVGLTARQATPVAEVRKQRDEPAREPQVRIGTIEVTVAAPPPLPPAPPAPAQPLPAAAVPAPVARLSRPSMSYGLGQG